MRITVRLWVPITGTHRDNLRLVGLKLVFLVVSGAMSLLGLPHRESWWKDAEILILRHEYAAAVPLGKLGLVS
jgi:hypothetical protein